MFCICSTPLYINKLVLCVFVVAGGGLNCKLANLAEVKYHPSLHPSITSELIRILLLNCGSSASICNMADNSWRVMNTNSQGSGRLWGWFRRFNPPPFPHPGPSNVFVLNISISSRFQFCYVARGMCFDHPAGPKLPEKNHQKYLTWLEQKML